MRAFFYVCVCGIFIYSCKKEAAVYNTYFTQSTLSNYRFVERITPAQLYASIDTNSAIGAIKPQYDIQVYEVEYRTTSYDSQTVFAKGIICMPDLGKFVIPVISLQHGAVFSKYNIKTELSDENYLISALLCAESGAAVCMPYYIGLGNVTASHHFMNAVEESNAVIDILRSVSDLAERTSSTIRIKNEIILAGYSQGAHASLATQLKMENQFHGAFNLKLNILISGIYSFRKSHQLAYLTDSSLYSYTSVAPYLIKSIQETHKIYANYDFYLKQPYGSLISTIFASSLSEDSIINSFPKDARSLLNTPFRQDITANSEHPFWRAVYENDLTDSYFPKAPLYFYYSPTDEVVKSENTTHAYNTFKQTNENVYIENVGNVIHVYSCLAGIKRMRKWIYRQVSLIAY